MVERTFGVIKNAMRRRLSAYVATTAAERLGGPHPYVFVALAALLTAGALIGFREIAGARDRARFENASASILDAIRERVAAYESILLAGRSLFISEGSEIDLAKFRAYVKSLEVEHRYPGIQGIGFSRRMMKAEVPDIMADLHAQGLVNFRVWPEDDREEYHSIVALEPLDRRNAAALGFDMFTEPTRREAMSRARDTGEPAASGRVTLVQEIDAVKQAGFLLYVPIYRDGARPSDLETRRRTLVGFIYSPFRMDDLLAGVLGSRRMPRVAFELYDGVVLHRDALMHRQPVPSGYEPKHVGVQYLWIAGRPWTLLMQSTPAFDSSSTMRWFPWLLGVGLVVNAAFWLAARAQVRARRREAQARTRLAILADSSRRFTEANLDPAQVVHAMCHDIAHHVHDSCAVSLIDESGTVLRLAEAWNAVPEAEHSMRAILQDLPIPVGETSVGQVAATGRSVLVPRVDIEALKASVRPEYRAYLERFPIGSLLVVPLRARDRILGTVTTSRRPDAPPYTESDQQLLQDLADRAGLAIENARLAERLRTSMHEAQQAVQLRDEFMSVAGHELRTPLAALLLQIEGLLLQLERGDFGTSTPRLRERIEKTHKHVTRLEVLIKELLDVTRIVSGRLAMQTEEVELTGLLGDIVERFSENLARARCEVSIQAPEPVVGQWDRVRLDQVISNLLANALKYGAGKPIEVRVSRENGHAKIRVQDHGIGIAEQDKQRIFGRFERAVSNQNYGGLGLGLWISQEIVRGFGGTIEVESTLGVGSTFTVALPVTPQEHA